MEVTIFGRFIVERMNNLYDEVSVKSSSDVMDKNDDGDYQMYFYINDIEVIVTEKQLMDTAHYGDISLKEFIETVLYN